MTTRSTVLEALRLAGEKGLSGEALALRLGVSRVAVGKHVAALRDAGYEIAAVPGSGYRLIAAPDLPLPAEVEPLLGSSLWIALQGGGATGSTNDDLSAVLRPAVTPAEVASLALAAALGVVLGLERLGVRAQLKWPNDVLLGDGKLAGVLLEMSAEADSVDWVVAGVGLNVRRPSRVADAAPGAAYIVDAAPGVGLAQAAAAELDGIAGAYERWREAGFAALRADYEARFALTGIDVQVTDLLGTMRAAGIVEGIDDAGRMLVRANDGAQCAVVAGEVTLRR